MAASPPPRCCEVEGLKTHFFTRDGVVRAVDGVSFTIQPGETLALVGESGCGKSVTSLSILRLIASPPGRTVAGGHPLRRARPARRCTERAMRDVRGNEISMIFQEPMTSLNPVLTIGRQIAETLVLHRGLARAAGDGARDRDAAPGEHPRARAARAPSTRTRCPAACASA